MSCDSDDAQERAWMWIFGAVFIGVSSILGIVGWAAYRVVMSWAH